LRVTSQKRESIKIAKKLLFGRVISRKGQHHKTFAGGLPILVKPGVIRCGR